MADEDVPLPPIEIPWKLAATTQPLSAGEPAETALSLFFFEPDDETLTSQFPDEKLVFVKFTTSISPASFPAELSPRRGELPRRGHSVPARSARPQGPQRRE